jgi:hypothetical protein
MVNSNSNYCDEMKKTINEIEALAEVYKRSIKNKETEAIERASNMFKLVILIGCIEGLCFGLAYSSSASDVTFMVFFGGVLTAICGTLTRKRGWEPLTWAALSVTITTAIIMLIFGLGS